MAREFEKMTKEYIRKSDEEIKINKDLKNLLRFLGQKFDDTFFTEVSDLFTSIDMRIKLFNDNIDKKVIDSFIKSDKETQAKILQYESFLEGANKYLERGLKRFENLESLGDSIFPLFSLTKTIGGFLENFIISSKEERVERIKEKEKQKLEKGIFIDFYSKVNDDYLRFIESVNDYKVEGNKFNNLVVSNLNNFVENVDNVVSGMDNVLNVSNLNLEKVGDKIVSNIENVNNEFLKMSDVSNLNLEKVGDKIVSDIENLKYNKEAEIKEKKSNLGLISGGVKSVSGVNKKEGKKGDVVSSLGVIFEKGFGKIIAGIGKSLMSFLKVSGKVMIIEAIITALIIFLPILLLGLFNFLNGFWVKIKLLIDGFIEDFMLAVGKFIESIWYYIRGDEKGKKEVERKYEVMGEIKRTYRKELDEMVGKLSARKETSENLEREIEMLKVRLENVKADKTLSDSDKDKKIRDLQVEIESKEKWLNKVLADREKLEKSVSDKLNELNEVFKRRYANEKNIGEILEKSNEKYIKILEKTGADINYEKLETNKEIKVIKEPVKEGKTASVNNIIINSDNSPRLFASVSVS